MLHQLMLEVAELGGEAIFGLLLLASIASVAIISNRIWFFTKHWVDADLFARQLLPALDARDWAKARALARRSAASLHVVILAGLSQAELGRSAVKIAMRSAKSHERSRLEGQLGMLGAIGKSSLLLGLLGSLLDAMRLCGAAGVNAGGPPAADKLDLLVMLGPTAAGLLVAIPALLAASGLKSRMRLTLRQIDSLAQMVLLLTPGKRAQLKTPRIVEQHRAA